MIKESGILNINTKNLIYNYNFFKKLKSNLTKKDNEKKKEGEKRRRQT